MAHEIAGNDTVVSTKREWHRKEHLIEPGLSPREGVKRALPWETELIPVYGTLDTVENGVPRLLKIEAPDFRMHVRMDDRSCLGIVGKGYQPVPNQVLAEAGEALVGADATVKVETCGSLRGGKRVFLCAKTHGIEAASDDQLSSYLTITNCHDGTGAFRIYFCTVRIVCANTFRYSESRAGNAGFWFRHDGDVRSKIEEARKALGLATKTRDVVAEEIEKMRSLMLRQESVDAYFGQVYEATFGSAPSRKIDTPAPGTPADQVDDLLDAVNRAADEYEEKRATVLECWNENHEKDVARGTLWGAFNAVTEYHDHQRGRGKPQERKLTDARMHSNMFGASALDKQKARAIALEGVA